MRSRVRHWLATHWLRGFAKEFDGLNRQRLGVVDHPVPVPLSGRRRTTDDPSDPNGIASTSEWGTLREIMDLAPPPPPPTPNIGLPETYRGKPPLR